MISDTSSGLQPRKEVENGTPHQRSRTFKGGHSPECGFMGKRCWSWTAYPQTGEAHTEEKEERTNHDDTAGHGKQEVAR